jgi:hypothetical protein
MTLYLFNVSELLACEILCSNDSEESGVFEHSDNHIEALENNLTIEDIDSILSLIHCDRRGTSWNETRENCTQY